MKMKKAINFALIFLCAALIVLCTACGKSGEDNPENAGEQVSGAEAYDPNAGAAGDDVLAGALNKPQVPADNNGAQNPAANGAQTPAVNGGNANPYPYPPNNGAQQSVPANNNNQPTEPPAPAQNTTTTTVDANEAIRQMVTPAGSVVQSSTPNSVVITSEKPMQELAGFYQQLAGPAGVTQISVDDTREDYWKLDGTYQGNKKVSIEMQQNGESVTITVKY